MGKVIISNQTYRSAKVCNTKFYIICYNIGMFDNKYSKE